MRAVPFILAFALMLYAFIDCARTPREELPAGLPRLVWVLFILLGVGALVWVVLRVTATVNAAGTAGPSPAGPSRPAGPVAPDDDPAFLARLEQDRRRAERRRRQQDQHGPGTAGGDTGPHRDGDGPHRPSPRGGEPHSGDTHRDDRDRDEPGHEGGSPTGRPEDGTTEH